MAAAAVVDSLKWRLIEAVKANDVGVAKRCIDNGASPDTICDCPLKGSSVLCLASDRGFAKMVSLLVERGANVEHRDTEYYSTPFLEAAFRGHVAVIGLLVELGCNRLARNKVSG
jgi:serine/threonine-protein phosphatase 6 regulatory ankyrin repeat subunit B